MTGSFNGGPLAAQASSSNNSAITFDSTGQALGVTARSVSVSSTDAGVTSPVAAAFSVNVLDHADATFAPADADDQNVLDLVFELVEGASSAQTFALSNRLGGRAGLVFSGLVETGDDGLADQGFLRNNISAFGTLAAGGSSDEFEVLFDASALTEGQYIASYTLNLWDEALAGAAGQSLTINVIGNVAAVPEPAALAVLAMGGAALLARRRRVG